MFPPEAYQPAREAARYHLQVLILEVSLPFAMPGMARLKTRVETLFRGDGRLPVGSLVEFELGVFQDRNVEFPDTPDIWTPVDQVAKGMWLEAYLDGDPPYCTVASWQTRSIQGPSLAAQL